jgi:hypothetical protein
MEANKRTGRDFMRRSNRVQRIANESLVGPDIGYRHLFPPLDVLGLLVEFIDARVKKLGLRKWQGQLVGTPVPAAAERTHESCMSPSVDDMGTVDAGKSQEDGRGGSAPCDGRRPFHAAEIG